MNALEEDQVYEINWGIVGRDPETPPQLRPSWAEAKAELTKEINAYAQDFLPFEGIYRANMFLRELAEITEPKDISFSVEGYSWWVMKADWVKELPDFPS